MTEFSPSGDINQQAPDIHPAQPISGNNFLDTLTQRVTDPVTNSI